MKVFELENNVVKVSPEVLTIKDFNNIWVSDKSKTKDEAFKAFAFIYHTCDYNSPYADLHIDEKESKVLEEVVQDKKFKITPEILSCQEIYKSLIETPLTRLVAASKRKIDDIVTFFDDTEILSSKDAKETADIMKQIAAIATNLKGVEDLVKKEKLANKTKYRADIELERRYNE
jgi:hypothetical protein